MFYIYRSTTDKLGDALNGITEAGDTIREIVHVGGRDWVLICRKGGGERFSEAIREQTEELAAAKAANASLARDVGLIGPKS